MGWYINVGERCIHYRYTYNIYIWYNVVYHTRFPPLAMVLMPITCWRRWHGLGMCIVWYMLIWPSVGSCSISAGFRPRCNEEACFRHRKQTGCKEEKIVFFQRKQKWAAMYPLWCTRPLCFQLSWFGKKTFVFISEDPFFPEAAEVSIRCQQCSDYGLSEEAFEVFEEV